MELAQDSIIQTRKDRSCRGPVSGLEFAADCEAHPPRLESLLQLRGRKTNSIYGLLGQDMLG